MSVGLADTRNALMPRRPSPGRVALNTVLLLLVVVALKWAFSGLLMSGLPVRERLPQLRAILSSMFLPPDFSYTGVVLVEMLRSMQIAALGTAVASVLAIPFGVLAARNLTRLPVLPYAGKSLLNLIRTFPELVLALMFIRAVGPGPFAGVLAVGIHSIGMMGKLYAERIETVERAPLEALSASGGSPVEIFRHGVIPEVFPDFLSFALYRFDLNIRSATVLGLVGAGGIGQAMDLQIKAQAWPRIGLILIVVVVTVGVVDFISAKLRARLA